MCFLAESFFIILQLIVLRSSRNAVWISLHEKGESFELLAASQEDDCIMSSTCRTDVSPTISRFCTDMKLLLLRWLTDNSIYDCL